MLNFTFGGNTDLTYEELQARRRVAERLAQSRAAPSNVGEGLNRIGEAIAYRMISRRNREAEDRLREESEARWEELMGGLLGGAPSGVSGYGGATASSRSFTGPSTTNTAGVASAVSGSTSAPTAGLPYMLPDTDPDAGDPRRGQFPTAAPRVDDPNVYTTSVTGATSGVDPAIIDIVGNSVEQAYGPGAAVGVSSGLRPGSAGSQHSAGQALDFGVTDRAGNRSTYQDPRIFDAARVAASQGASGIGIGPDYMGGNTFHFDTGAGGGNGAPNFGSTVRTWSDWNTSGPRGAADPQGAGDPRFGLQAELQGIRNGAAVPTGTVGPATASARNPAPLTATASAQNGPTGGVSGGGGMQDPRAMIAALMPVLSDPMLSEGQRMVAGVLMQQALGRAFPGPVQPIEINGRLVDPNTFEVLADFSDQPTAGDYARAEDVNGVLRWIEGPNAGQPVFPDVEASGGSDMTESERRIFMFNNIQQETAPAINMIEDNGFNPASFRTRFADGVIGGNYFDTPEGRMYRAASSAWAESALRLATGAAATPEESERIRNMYFAQPGDDLGTIQFKRAMREAYQNVMSATLSGNVDELPPNPLVFAVESFYQNQENTPPADATPSVANPNPSPSPAPTTDDEPLDPDTATQIGARAIILEYRQGLNRAARRRFDEMTPEEQLQEALANGG